MAVQPLITPTTCDSIDRFTDFVRESQKRAAGAITLVGMAGEPLKLRFVRVGEGSGVRYQIEVVA